MTDYKKYLNFKLINSLINSDAFLEVLDSYSSVILTVEFIDSINDFSLNYVNTNKLYKEQVSRFKTLVEYVKQNYSLSCEDLFVDILKSIDETNYSNRSSYCVENYMSRFKGHNFYRIYTQPHLIPEFIKKIKLSISKDYFFLMMLTEFSEEEFNSSLQFAILDEYFLLSVNQIIAEFPQILKNETFVKRIKMITNENMKQIDQITNTKDKRIIFKESKYYNTHLKEE